ncbi:MAG TPA: hypothetical protein VGJ97_07195 [Anaerolineaceae bacterium]|jgi:hypothetical protein
MNRHEIRHLFSPHFATLLGGKVFIILATILFWAAIFALLSCPAWLPGLIDHSIIR